jgi:hypothetical protein
MENKKEASETLSYAFDFPLTTESGSVHITDHQIILQFPEKPSSFVKYIKIPRNINLFIDNSLQFSLDWIPIHTWSDYSRMRDMFEKCLQSYTYLTDGDTTFSPHTYLWNPVKWATSISTNFSQSSGFSLDCYENNNDTCIQLDLPTSEQCEKETPLHFQICIGKNIVFCTHRDLLCITHAAHVHFIVKFILYKLLNC